MRVELWRFDAIAILVRLASTERGGFELCGPHNGPRRQNPESNVGGIEPVVGDGCLWERHSRESVHERRRTEGGLAGQTSVDEERSIPARDAVGRGQLHEEIVRVLPVDEAG